MENLIVNLKPLMMKLHNGGTLTEEEGKSVVQFYLEVVNFVQYHAN
jgi:hypothetical protein